jgi:hypothetical protein
MFVFKVCLVHVLEALGVRDAELLANIAEMNAHTGVAEAFPQVLGELILDVDFFVGAVRGGPQSLNGCLSTRKEEC